MREACAQASAASFERRTTAHVVSAPQAGSMERPSLMRRLRWMFVTVLCVAVAAGCAAPDQSDQPVDLNQDADGDGIPDGNSPVPNANEPDKTPTSGNATNETAPDAGNVSS